MLVNTVLGLVIDIEARRPTLGNVGGGVSGPGILPVSLRAIYECREAFPDAAIVGVGGVSQRRRRRRDVDGRRQRRGSGHRDVRRPARARGACSASWSKWMTRHGVAHVDELIGAAHG